MNRNDSKFDFLNILPVGITYLHREMFRSNVSVRIGDPIRIDYNFITKTVGMRDFDVNNCLTNDERYQVSKYVTKILSQRMFQLVISVPHWHTIVLSHLARQIAFPQSSSARYGTHLVNYIDITRQFSIVFAQKQDKLKEFEKLQSESESQIKQNNNANNNSNNSQTNPNTDDTKNDDNNDEPEEQNDITGKHLSIEELSFQLSDDDDNKESKEDDEKNSGRLTKNDEMVNECYDRLEIYFAHLRKYGLKDSRILELSNFVESNQSRIITKFSIFSRMILRLLIALLLFSIGAPGLVPIMPIIISWRFVKRYFVNQGVEMNYDGIAQTKVSECFCHDDFIYFILVFFQA